MNTLYIMNIEIKTKKCNKCENIKEISYFINIRTGKETSRCLECRKKQNDWKNNASKEKKNRSRLFHKLQLIWF